MEDKGKISIIMATYNRSKVLYYSILSILNQPYSNWELIVVGDHCTDDTEIVVNSFNDPRIFFHNLPENFGEQSYPNNVGMKMSTGDYIAFLNHDDIWLQDHLVTMLNHLNNTNSDFVFGMVGIYGSFQEKAVIAYSQSGKYEIIMLTPASSWLMKREVYIKVGDWNYAKDLISFPSEDFIYRVYKAGFKIMATNKLTIIKPQSTYDKNLYIKETNLNKLIWDEITINDKFRENFLTDVIIANYGEHSLKVHLYKIIREIVKIFATLSAKYLRTNPTTITNIIAYGIGKGKGIKKLRKFRGLDKKGIKNGKN